MLALILAPTWSAGGRAQTAGREGNEYDFRDWQPTQGAVTKEERAAGINQSATQRKAEDSELQNVYQDLMRQNQSLPSTQPGNAR